MKRSLFMLMLLLFVFSVVPVSNAYATDPSKESPTDWIKHTGSTDPLSGVTDQAKDVGRSAFSLVQTLVRIVATLVVTWLGLSWMSSKSGTDLKDKKSWAMNIVIGLLIAFGVNFLITLIFNIATALTP